MAHVMRVRAFPPSSRLVIAIGFLTIAACGGGSDTEPVCETCPPPPPPETCPPAYATPDRDECDGTDLLAEDAWVEVPEALRTLEGPGGVRAIGLDDALPIDIRNEGCRRLGADQEAFSVSLWFQLVDPEDQRTVTLIGNTNTSGRPDGWVINVSYRGGNWVVSLSTGDVDGRDHSRSTRPQPIDPDGWNHLTMVHRPAGQAVLYVNGAEVDFERPGDAVYADVFNDVLRLGDPGHGERASADIAAVRSYRRALHGSETRALYLEHAPSARGLSVDAVENATGRLTAHFEGTATLGATEFASAVREFTDHAQALPTRRSALEAALDLVDLYETRVGPLFMSEEHGSEITQAPVDGEAEEVREARGMVDVHQAIVDHAFVAEAVEGCDAVFEGRQWRTAERFPGAFRGPAEPAEFTVPVDASKPARVGHRVAFDDGHARRPTGLYLPPGSVGEMRVPAALVGRGYHVLVGAHSHTQDHDPSSGRAHRRLPGVSRRYPIERSVTKIANPLGGGVYVEVPYLADAGVVDVAVSGVVEAPFFSTRSFDRMTEADWQARRAAPPPWTDIVTDTALIQVPTSWVYAKDDFTDALQNWDEAMNGVTQFMGLSPEDRNDVVLYIQPDVWIRHGAGGIGYPQTNSTVNLDREETGDSGHYLVTNPMNQLEMHELGHAQLMPKYPGESEAIVNLPMAYVLNTRFEMDLDEAFQRSAPGWSGGGSFQGYTVDQAAVHWMITANFRDGNEMDRTNSTLNEMRYQSRGYAKYTDIARLFGWEAYIAANRQSHRDYEAGIGRPEGMSEEDARTLHLSEAAGVDLRPLIHFWGIHPDDPAQLAAAIVDAGLSASDEIEELLLRYRTLIPEDNNAFDAFFETIYPQRGPGSNPDFGAGWYLVWVELWDASHAAAARAALDEILALYF